jgi:hypothetical protein
MDKEILEIVKTFTPITLGAIGIIITLLYSSANKKLSHQKMEKDLFKEFNERYDSLNDSLSLLSDIKTIEELKSTESLIDKKSMYNILIDYFNLCAEQFYWKNKDRISPEIWKSWHSGMNYYYSNFPIVKELWRCEIANEGYISYYLNRDEDFFK